VGGGSGTSSSEYSIEYKSEGKTETSSTNSKQVIVDGTIISFVIDFHSAWCEVWLNLVKSHRFKIKSNLICEDFVLGVCFGTLQKHSVRLLPLSLLNLCYLADKETYAVAAAVDATNAAAGAAGAAAAAATDSAAAATTTVAVSSAPRQLFCRESHLLTAFVDMPPTYGDADFSYVTCSECERKCDNIAQLSFFHCPQCEYDICFACSITSAQNQPGSAKVFKEAEASRSKKRCGFYECGMSLANILPEGPCFNALEHLIEISRLEMDKPLAPPLVEGASSLAPPLPLSSTSSNPYALFARKRQASLAMDANSDFASQTPSIALSAMFALAVMRQSLSGILEVVTILTAQQQQQQQQQLKVIPPVRTFVAFFLGSEAAASHFFLDKEQEQKQQQLEEICAYFDIDMSVLRELPLSQSDLQALLILAALGEIISSDAVVYPITNDFELDILLAQLEKGAIALREQQLTRESFIDICLCITSLRIMYNNLTKVVNWRAKSAYEDSFLDVPCSCSELIQSPRSPARASSPPLILSGSTTYRLRILNALKAVVSNGKIEPLQLVGKFAIRFFSLTQLTPRATEQVRTKQAR